MARIPKYHYEKIYTERRLRDDILDNIDGMTLDQAIAFFEALKAETPNETVRLDLERGWSDYDERTELRVIARKDETDAERDARIERLKEEERAKVRARRAEAKKAEEAERALFEKLRAKYGS